MATVNDACIIKMGSDAGHSAERFEELAQKMTMLSCRHGLCNLCYADVQLALKHAGVSA